MNPFAAKDKYNHYAVAWLKDVRWEHRHHIANRDDLERLVLRGCLVWLQQRQSTLKLCKDTGTVPAGPKRM